MSNLWTMAAECTILISSAALPHIWLFPVKDPLHQQPVQNSIDVPHPCPPVPHMPSHLHPGKPDEVPQVEVISLIVIPVFSLAIHPLDQGIGSGVWTCVHGRAIG